LMEPMMPIISTIFKMWNSFSSTTTPKFTPPPLATLLPPWEYYPKSPHPTWFHHRKVIYSIKVFSIKTKICITTIQSINMSKLIPRCTPYEVGYYWNVWGFEIVIPHHLWYNSCWIWANITICINMRVCVTFIEEMRLWFLPCLSAHKN